MINAIWGLPRLTHCHLYIGFHQNERLFPRLNTISSSLEYLSVGKFSLYLSKLDHLFQQTPHLQHFDVRLFDDEFDQPLSCSIPLMITLKLIIQNSLYQLDNFLQNLPNLCHLTVETFDIDLDGQQWEQIIIDHLPKLETFQLKMHIKLEDDDDKQLKIDKLIASFQSSFWLDEHQWFVRCHYVEECCLNSIILYTLPYAFGYFDPIVKISSKSTCPHENDYWSYNRVHSLIYRTPIIRESTLCKIAFPNIHHLRLSLPSNDQFWSVITTLDQLISLDLALHDDDYNNDVRSQLQVVLDRAPRLYSLAFRSWSDSQMCLVDNRSLSVRRLDLQGYDEDWLVERWFNDEECAKLCCSSLGIQCEVLLIRVEHRTTILDLVNRMTNLRALNIKCRDDPFNETNDRSSFTEDELVKWLKECLPSTWTIARHPADIDQNEFRNWISNAEGLNSASYETSTSGLILHDNVTNCIGGNEYSFSSQNAFESTADINTSYGLPTASGELFGDTAIHTSSVHQPNQYLSQSAKNIYFDPDPQIVRRATTEGPIIYQQKILVRFLQPPAIPPPGPLIIKEVRPVQPPPPLPLIVRQRAQPLPPPSPLILRERPPIPPTIIASQTIIRRLPARPVPPRSVIIERIPPPPQKPRDIIIERWIPYGPQPKRRTIVQRAPAAVPYPQPRNIVVVYEAAQAHIMRQFKKLGIIQENPQAYIARYGSSLLDSATLIQEARNAGVVEDISPPAIPSSIYVGASGNPVDFDLSNTTAGQNFSSLGATVFDGIQLVDDSALVGSVNIAKGEFDVDGTSFTTTADINHDGQLNQTEFQRFIQSHI
ncbi:unnamed protein product [Rotaria sp. Silwood1]|nr:unnamed protein product [Rotaria sp. Silwood1]